MYIYFLPETTIVEATDEMGLFNDPLRKSDGTGGTWVQFDERSIGKPNFIFLRRKFEAAIDRNGMPQKQYDAMRERLRAERA